MFSMNRKNIPSHLIKYFEPRRVYKQKDDLMIPHRVYDALMMDGWYGRQDIIWHKPNPMPESVTDRCTKAHEYIFLLTKSARYWYDHTAILEPANYDGRKDTVFKGSLKYDDETLARVGGERWPNKIDTKYTPDDSEGMGGAGTNWVGHSAYHGADGRELFQRNGDGIPARNKRSVWTVTTKPYSGAHYAVFPPDLIEPCVLAGCPPKVCVECGAPWERVVEKIPMGKKLSDRTADKHEQGLATACGGAMTSPPMSITHGWQPTCTCNADTRPGIVLDPFIGSGTTAMVARKHGRHAIGLDLNFEYLTTNARERLQYGSYVPVADGINQLTID